MVNDNFRARLSPKPNGQSEVLGTRDVENILRPLWETNGIIFPYTPTVSTGAQASYEEYKMTHSIYKYNAFQNSDTDVITITGDFTAQTQSEAQYLLAVMHFLRTSTKAYFGAQGDSASAYSKLRTGTPPPVLLFNYLGQYQFKNVPVIIKQFNYVLEPGVDYVRVYPLAGAQETYVPSWVSISVVLDTQYNTKKIRNEFDLDQFRQGKLIDKGFI